MLGLFLSFKCGFRQMYSAGNIADRVFQMQNLRKQPTHPISDKICRFLWLADRLFAGAFNQEVMTQP